MAILKLCKGDFTKNRWKEICNEVGVKEESIEIAISFNYANVISKTESSSLTPWYEEQWYDEDITNIMKEMGVEVAPETLKKTQELCSEYFDDKSDRNEIIKQIIEENFMENE